MKTVTVRNVTIGSGIPKICVPIVGSTLTEIESQAAHIASVLPDVVEWRADWYQDVLSQEATCDAIRSIRRFLPNTPLLFTFRSHVEGGQMEIPPTVYRQLIRQAVQYPEIDLVDIELYLGDAAFIEACHAMGTPVILSNHDFTKTPSREELLSRLHAMEAMHCDIAKIAVMPQTAEDVICLLSVTEEYSRTAQCPLITMSMSQLGLVSRLCGSLTGSALTFGSAGHASAPGQIPVQQLRDFLSALQVTQ